jgi:cytochrome c553
MKVKSLAILALITSPMLAHAVGNIDNGKTLAASKCETCHGAYGVNTGARPNLAGQKEAYLVRQLQAFKSGTRINATMQTQAAGLSDQDIEDLAAYFAGNNVIPSYSDNGILKLPYVRVTDIPFQAELEYSSSNSLFSIKSATKR